MAHHTAKPSPSAGKSATDRARALARSKPADVPPVSECDLASGERVPRPGSSSPPGGREAPRRVTLIGGPADGNVLNAPGGDPWVDVGTACYVLRETFPLDSEVPEGWVGIFLPLYASLLAARRRSPMAKRS